eukprot:scaffold1662_cov121-Skeletonema_marinoi.AAC.2
MSDEHHTPNLRSPINQANIEDDAVAYLWPAAVERMSYRSIVIITLQILEIADARIMADN